jgi:transposase-like protein
MRPVSMFAKGSASEVEQLGAGLRGRWREAARAVMVLLSLQGLAAAQIAVLLDCHPATVRRWISRFNDEGLAGLADRPPVRAAPAGRAAVDRADRRAAGPPGPVDRAADPAVPGLAAGQHAHPVRRVRLVAIWRRPRLTARGDPAHDHVVAGIMARLLELPRRSVVCAEDETHLNLLPHVRAS